MPGDDVFEGGCFCGAIRYAFSGVADAGYCHCSLCRRTTGAPILAWVNTPSDRFAIERGHPKAVSTSDAFERHFCGACGTHLFSRSKDGCWPYVSVHHGTIDRAGEIRPRVHLCYADRLPWFAVEDDLPRIDGSTLSHFDAR